MVTTDIVITRDNKDFRRLQFLFWKKLDRNQRIRVLAELDMLPYDFEAPPVWLRRGLDAARRQGKLQELWDSVMNCLPDVQQEHNPFYSACPMGQERKRKCPFGIKFASLSG